VVALGIDADLAIPANVNQKRVTADGALDVADRAGGVEDALRQFSPRLSSGEFALRVFEKCLSLATEET
jgi:hypothetical protein